ncbi:EAL domain-containing protein [Oceanobacter mangrovi]|uniref:EAL domain-containing protein n=1 Tax=Oceanobacter mangrovi TaxID=2862510 RepID=UPI001C8DA80A|nr:EAL domain-containing protein [Oceanobacter mangrovi]
MSSPEDTLHLLILMESRNEAEGIVSLLRNSGSATRVHFITSLEDFSEQLEAKSWDLLIAEEQANGLEVSTLQHQINRFNKDLPLILINREVDLIAMETALKRGACTMVPIGENNLLVLAIQREITHLRTRREKRSLEVRLRDAEKRAQALLESSRDAVAYAQDGMHLFANAAYLQMFGFASVDELEGMPLLDMVDSSGQNDFKQFFKKYLAASHQTAELNTIGVASDGKLFPMRMTLSPATYAEERCTQVVIQSSEKNTAVEAKLREISNLDILTGLHNKPYFMTQLEIAVDNAVLGGSRGAILYINIDGFGRIRANVGIAKSEMVLVEMAQALRKHQPEGSCLARISEDIFAITLHGKSVDQTLEFAESIRSHIANMLFDLGDRTITTTVSIGVALVNDSSSNPVDVLQQAHSACYKVREEEDHKNGNGVALFSGNQAASSKGSSASLEDAVTEALKLNSFKLSFQPLISLRGEEIEHYEARFKLPYHGDAMSAGGVINEPTISDTLKRKIDRWVILNTVKRLSEHQHKGHTTRVFLNLSGPSILDESLPNWISVAMRAARLPKGAVIIQITEDDCSRMLKQAQKFAQALSELQISMCLSRFGCSLEPMKNLQFVPAQYVKVDVSYTRELANNQKQLQDLLKSLHEQEKQTIVPMVESASTLANLWQMGVHFVQGDYVQSAQEAMNYNFEEEGSF